MKLFLTFALRATRGRPILAARRPPGEITLLDGEDPPSDLSGRDRHGHYVSVPIELWTSGHILEMKAREGRLLEGWARGSLRLGR